METRRDETSPLIIEEEKSCPHRPSIVATSCYHLNPSWRRPARGRMKATSRQNRLPRGSWERGHFEIVCAQHIHGVGDDVGEVSDGGDVENSRDLPRNLPIHWNVTNASSRTATDAICLVTVEDFCFSQQVFACSIFHISQLFLLDLWASSWHWNVCNRWVLYWVFAKSTSWIRDRISSAFLTFSYKIMTITIFVKND